MFTPIAPEDNGSTLSTGLIVVIVLVTAVTIVVIVVIVAIVVAVRCTKRDQLSSSSVDFGSLVKGIDNAYQQYPGPNRQAKGEVFVYLMAT